MSEIKDIHNGDYVMCWRDEDFIFLNFLPFVCISFPKEEWDNVKKDLKKIINKKWKVFVLFKKAKLPSGWEDDFRLSEIRIWKQLYKEMGLRWNLKKISKQIERESKRNTNSKTV